MTDTTYEAPERIEIESECGHANRYNSEDRKTLLRGPDDAPDYFCGEYVRADLVQAAVAAALREAINRVNGCDRVSEVQPAILALITPDAQAALDRVRAAERERAYNAGRKHERDLIYAFAQRMGGKGRCAVIREGSNERSEEGE